MNPRVNYSEDIKRVLGEIVDDKNSVKWSDFTLRMMDTIIVDKKPDTTTNQLKRTWKSHFTTYTKQLNLGINKSDDNWHIIENRISNIQNTVSLQDINNTVDSVSENSGSTKNSRSLKSSSSSTKSSNSGSQLSETITTKEKEEILNIYRNLDEEKLWRLSTGKTVEKKMIELVEKSIYEHPAHSFILDPDDENWTDYFTEEELNEIRTHKSKELPTLPRELVDFLNNIKQMNINEMHEFISGIYFNPINDYICHWAKKCLLEGIELFMTDFFKCENLTERDLLSRVWRLILLAFDQGKMRIREEKYSKATNTQINKKRKLSSEELIERKATSKRTDQLIKFGNYELGTVEGSKIDDEYSTKFFLDSMKKAPKAMKDMLLQLMKAAPHKKHDLRTIAIITSKLEVDMLIMDIPENYVFRVQRTETFKYPCVFDMFTKEIRNCLEIIWLARMILEETVEHLTSPTSHVPIKFKGKKQNDFLPTFYKKKNPSNLFTSLQ